MTTSSHRPFFSLYWVASALAGLAVGLGSLWWSDPVEVIVDRGDDYIELYIGLPATGLIEDLAMPAEALASEDGTVDFLRFREKVWDLADAVLRSVDSRIASEPLKFEATSLMVHPTNERLPFRDSYDGNLAASICSASIPETPPRLNELYAYSGFYAFADHTDRPLNLTLPKTDRLPILVHVRDHSEGVLVNEAWHLVWDGGLLSIK